MKLNELENIIIESDDEKRVKEFILLGANTPGLITTSPYDFKEWLNKFGKWDAKIFHGYLEEIKEYTKDAERLIIILYVGNNISLFDIEKILDDIVDKEKQKFNFSIPYDMNSNDKLEICILKQ